MPITTAPVTALSVVVTAAAPVIAEALAGLSAPHRIEFSYRPDAVIVSGFTTDCLSLAYPRLVNVFRAAGWSHRCRYDDEWLRMVEVVFIPPALQSRTDLPAVA